MAPIFWVFVVFALACVFVSLDFMRIYRKEHPDNEHEQAREVRVSTDTVLRSFEQRSARIASGKAPSLTEKASKGGDWRKVGRAS